MTKEREALTLAQEVIQMLGAPSPLHFSKEEIIKWQECNTAIKEALAQPEQEPVAWMREGWGPDCGPYIEFYRDDEMGWRDRKEWTPLYTTPPQRKPLTLVELSYIFASIPSVPFDGEWQLELSRAIEAAHGIKGKS